MEIVDPPGAEIGGLVEVAFAENREEAELIEGLLEGAGIHCLVKPAGLNGPMVGVGLLPRSAQRILVDPALAEAARRVIGETMVAKDSEGATVAEDPALATAGDASAVEAASGRAPRGYGLIGAYARIWAWSLGALALAFLVFLLLRAA